VLFEVKRTRLLGRASVRRHCVRKPRFATLHHVLNVFEPSPPIVKKTQGVGEGRGSKKMAIGQAPVSVHTTLANSQ